MDKLTAFLGVKKDRDWVKKFLLSLIAPALVIILSPLGLNFNQKAVVASLILVITWWSANIIKKIPASLFLLLVFALFSTAPLRTVFSFPLSENFFLIILTYLFSQGISNSGLVQKLLQPVFSKYAYTPLRLITITILIFALTFYVIPQPLARLIIVSCMLSSYLETTDVSAEAKSVLMYACFVFYGMVNMGARDADMIMNNAAVGFGGIEMSNGFWVKNMAVPTAVYVVIILVLFMWVFRRELKGAALNVISKNDTGDRSLTKKEKLTLLVILATVALWMTGSLLPVSSTVITLIATVIFFALGVLHKKDFRAIDVATLVFLSAAFSIGGVMKACGAADILFSKVRGIFPDSFSWLYLLTMVLITMCMHMVLGSNTTTLSVVIPGLILVGGGLVSEELVILTAIVSVSFHAILPFHSVALMIGQSNGHFPAKYVSKLGIYVTPLIFLVVLFIFMPWWHLTGLI